MKFLIILCLLFLSVGCNASDRIKAGVLVVGVLKQHKVILGNQRVPFTMQFDIKNIKKIAIRDLNKSCKHDSDLLFYILLNKMNKVKTITTSLINPCFSGIRKKDLKLLIIVTTTDNKKYTKEIKLNVYLDV